MAYIGNIPAEAYSAFQKQDFTTSATTSYTLDHPVSNQNELALFINFVRQEPTAAYTASGTSLTLTSATSSSDDMYCVYLGKAVQTVNPPNASVGTSQLASSLDLSSKTITLASNMTNTPSFRARKTTNQAVAQSTDVKITFDTEDFDTDSAFADSKFTVPSGKSGKYFLNFVNRIRNAADILHLEYSFYKNGSKEDRMSNVHNYISGDSQYQSYEFTTVMNLSASDYIEVYVNHSAGGNLEVNGGTGITFFQGFKLT